MSSTRKFGQWAEDKSFGYLGDQGFNLIRANYFSAYGEIDLIMQKDDLIIFVEVKARRSIKYGMACETISQSKQKKIIKTAYHFLDEYPCYEMHNLRFDVICIQIKQQVAKSILQDFSLVNYDLEWIKDAFNLDTI